jgi:PadR family transcriptional regulator, regulatory protein PadR
MTADRQARPVREVAEKPRTTRCTFTPPAITRSRLVLTSSAWRPGRAPHPRHSPGIAEDLTLHGIPPSTATTTQPMPPTTAKDLSAWRAQLRKGAAELAVLSLLARGESYGAQLLDVVRRHGGLDLSEGSIYPLLLRMQKEGTISSRWVEDEDASHPRKYYRLTRGGEKTLQGMLSEWTDFVAAMDELLEEARANATHADG